ncbi:MAG: histidine ammonia-lyase [Myxococcota bacterium]
MGHLRLTPGQLSFAQIRLALEGPITVELDEAARAAILESSRTVTNVLAEGRTVYGINTGFGLLAQTRIAEEDLETLQRSIVLSHAAGVGRPMAPGIVRLIMLLKINALARGFSGVKPALIDDLIALLRHDVLPIIPEKGSVGASGDLAPLAHMSCVLLGEGEALVNGTVMSGRDALAHAGLTPHVLGPKEGLALLNGTQASTALALSGLLQAQSLLNSGVTIGAMSVEAALGSRTPFDARIHEVRGQLGQIDVASAFRSLLGERSDVGDSHVDCHKVQDPYSLRCQPQVMGAALDQVRHAARILLREANAVSDNPLVFAGDNDILSGGNFHAEPVAMAADNIALAIAEIGSLSERRIALLIDKTLSGLPAFLVDNGGVNSGFMLAQVTAAALASENKSLAHPASVDSLPTSANQEDHVSMATFASRRLHDMASNTRGVLAVEYLAAAQGLDFRRPLTASEAVEHAHQRLRDVVPFYDVDRYFAPDIAAATRVLERDPFDGLLSLDG